MTPNHLGYLAFMLLAVAAFFLARRLFSPPRPASLTRLERLTLLLFAAFVGGTLAAKLPFVWDATASFWDWAAWAADGKTITTGLVGAYLSVEIVKLALGIKAKTGDGLAIPLAAALAVGRWGCFVNGCCAGQPSDLPWCVNFGDGVCRHPTQIYESLFHAVWVVILVQLNRRDTLRYQRLKLYLLAYCAFRFAVEFIRIEPPWLGALTYYQIVVAVFAAFLLGQWAIDAQKLHRASVPIA